MEQKDVFRFSGSAQMWKYWYRESGKNQRPHIWRVCKDAQILCVRLHRPYSRSLELACVLHDAAKGRPGYENYPDHGLASAALALELLSKDQTLTQAEVAAICAAIGDHDHQMSAPTSDLAAVLRAADAGKPSPGFYARKSVAWCLKHGMSQEDAFKNAFSRLISGECFLGSGSKAAVWEYSQGFREELAKAVKEIKGLSSANDIPGLIAAYEGSPDREDPDA